MNAVESQIPWRPERAAEMLITRLPGKIGSSSFDEYHALIMPDGSTLFDLTYGRFFSSTLEWVGFIKTLHHTPSSSTSTFATMHEYMKWVESKRQHNPLETIGDARHKVTMKKGRFICTYDDRE